MILNKITIANYKSISTLEIPIADFDERYLCFLGVNETGKTSILEAIDLKAIHQTTPIVYSKLCYRPAQENDEPISVKFHLTLEKDEVTELAELQKTRKVIETTTPTPTETDPAVPEKAEASPEEVAAVREPTKPIKVTGITYCYKIDVDSQDFEEITYEEGGEEKVMPDDLATHILEIIPSVEFWRGRENELISDEISVEDIKARANTPFNNCLQIAGLKAAHISLAKANGGRQSELGEKLTDKVTTYLNKRWPGHNIKIEFHVADERVTCSVIDIKNPSKERISPSARSDGFKKLVSFLLSLSVDYEENEVSDSLLLLDEPERYLHPEAQQNFRDELIAIASKNNNVVMSSTHSMYMVHKKHIDRCFGVEKKYEGNLYKTKIEHLRPDEMTFARINYSIFNIPTDEYHSELYGQLHMKYIESEDEPEKEVYTVAGFDKHYFPKEKKIAWKRKRGKKEVTEQVTIHSYIRHSIHHPENNLGNDEYTDAQLRTSIEALELLLYGKGK